jgi:hypothetical protein
MRSENYLTNIPEICEEYGVTKSLLVRREMIHIKHIFTEIFVRKTVQISDHKLNMNTEEYMEIMTRVIRKIFHYSRNYKYNLDGVVKENHNKFFPQLEMYKGLDTVIALDFDGVCTSNKFRQLYDLCIERCDKVFVVTANPTVSEHWFINREISTPNKIYACKGKEKKIRQLIELQKKHDQVFYVDNEVEYLEIAWIFGIKTFLYRNGKIKYFTMKTK